MISTTETPSLDKDVQKLEMDGRVIYLIGTAHVSQKSVDVVRNTIQTIRPATVCVELDDQRLESLRDKNRWEKLNLKEILKNGQMPTLIANLALSSYQKRMGNHLGVQPGSELIAAVEEAETIDAQIDLSDRNIQITLKRAWRMTGFFKKISLASGLLGSLFEKEEVSEEQLANLKEKDTLSAMMDEMGDELPIIKQVLIDERDQFLAEKIRQAPGETIVAVVGAGHCPGITRILTNEEPVDLEQISVLPSSVGLGTLLMWAIPMVILGSFAYLYSQDAALASASSKVWILANGVPTSIGALIALSHPLVIILAFVAAPITSLIPWIGAGVVTGLLQIYLVPPRVKELESLSEEIGVTKMWWKNRVLKVFLAFILPSLGSAIGTFIGAAELFNALFDT